MILLWFKHDKAGDYELYRVWNRSLLMAPGLKCVKWSMTRAVKHREKHTLGDFFKTDDEITQRNSHDNVDRRHSKWQVVLLIEAFKNCLVANSLLINYKRYLLSQQERTGCAYQAIPWCLTYSLSFTNNKARLIRQQKHTEEYNQSSIKTIDSIRNYWAGTRLPCVIKWEKTNPSHCKRETFARFQGPVKNGQSHKTELWRGKYSNKNHITDFKSM